jgi:hypothetical protein
MANNLAGWDAGCWVLQPIAQRLNTGLVPDSASQPERVDNRTLSRIKFDALTFVPCREQSATNLERGTVKQVSINRRLSLHRPLASRDRNISASRNRINQLESRKSRLQTDSRIRTPPCNLRQIKISNRQIGTPIQPTTDPLDLLPV